MPRRKFITPFYLNVTDDDEKTFSVEGPMSDDTPWVNAVRRAQDAGREVRCHTGADNLEDNVTDLAGRSYRQVPPGSILHPHRKI